MSCLVKIDLESVVAGSKSISNEPGPEEYVFLININGFGTRFPSQGEFKGIENEETILINPNDQNVFNQVIDTDPVNIYIKARVLEEDPISDDDAINSLDLHIPCRYSFSSLLSLTVKSTNGVIGKLNFRISFEQP